MNLRVLTASLVALVGIGSCDVCACVIPASADVEGSVSTIDDIPVPGTTLWAYVDEDRSRCFPSAVPSGMGSADSQGQYRIVLAVAVAADSLCVFVKARAPRNSGLRDTLVGPIRLSMRFQAPFDSGRLDVVLPR